MEIAAPLQTMFTDAPFYERFGKAGRAGFTLVEIGDWTRLDLSRVTEELSRHSLRLAAMTGADAFSLIDPAAHGEFLEYLSQSLAVAKSFGCERLIVQSADRGTEPAEPPASPAESADFTGRAAAAQALMDAADKAARAGVTLLLKAAPATGQSFSYLHTNSSAGSLVKVINSPALRLLFTFSLSRPIEDAAVSTFRKYQEYVGHVHVGEANLRVIGSVLADGFGYDGTVGLMVSTKGEEEKRIEEIRSVFGLPGQH